jgi:heme O synthase-like polyprenyltransferase
MKIDRMGVYVLLSHLIITLVILAIYGYTLHTGQGDETLKTILTVIIGYWFGSMGATAIRKNDTTKKDGEE